MPAHGRTPQEGPELCVDAPSNGTETGRSAARTRPASRSELAPLKARRCRAFALFGGCCRPATGTRGGLVQCKSVVWHGWVAQARVRDRHEALPELRRRVEDRRGDSGTSSDREDPHVPGAARAGSSERAGAPSGLSETNTAVRAASHHGSRGPAAFGASTP